ncbi:MAG: translation initiation factor IF-2 N-terminal domain-containing protein, partial [Agathobacter sp.]|nr:translation initiation factor IF-2 N-terminal domain-containing protein [Agathobacter sp.]
MEENEYMAKMRVHELAKELDIESKSIVEFLKGTEYEVKTA